MKFVSIESLKCAIAEEAIRNPNKIRAQFRLNEGEEFDVTAAQHVENWHHDPEGDYHTPEAINLICFNCQPYNGKLCAYTTDKGGEILAVSITRVEEHEGDEDEF